MQKLISEENKRYELSWDIEVLGTKTTRINAAFGKKKQRTAAETGVKPQKWTGRPGEFYYDCSFCKKELLGEGHVVQHYERSHYREEIKHVTLHKNDENKYYCPVTECTVQCEEPRTLRRHYATTTDHTVAQMLDAGIEVWHHLAQTRPVKR